MNEEIKKEFEMIRQSAWSTSVNILSLRIALVDKGVVTEKELEEYDNTAEETLKTLMLGERDKIKESLIERFGEDAVGDILNEIDSMMQKK